MIGKKLNEIKGYENMGMYIKFLKKEYLEDLLNGDIYMKNFKYFIELEKTTKVKGQGDKLEVAHVVRSTHVEVVDRETNKVIVTAPKGEIIERYSEMDKMPVFCVTSLNASDFVVTNIQGNILTAKIDLPLESQLLFEETFGETAVILTNDFVDRMIEEAKRMDFGIAIGDVQYQDYTYYSATRQKQFDEKSINILFWKDDFFKPQKEARFILINKSVDDYCTLSIGDIRGKSQVTTTKELLTDTEFEFPIIE